MDIEQLKDRGLHIAGQLLEILIVLAISLVLYYILRFLIGLLVKGMINHGPRMKRETRAWFRRRIKGKDLTPTSPMVIARRVQRGETMGSVLRSIAAIVISAGALIYIFGNIFEVNLTPLLASAGILGAALGFGAQTLVKDFLSGIFNLAEDQYGVGDVIDVGEAVGTVEQIGLRVTQVRSMDGTLWYVRNGEILRVGNMTQEWSRAVLDLPVSITEDPDHVTELVLQAASTVRKQPEYAPFILEDPQVTGMEDINANTFMIRALIKTAPAKQWEITRALRQQVRQTLRDAGIRLDVPFTTGTVMKTEVFTDDDSSGTEKPSETRE